MFDPAIIIQPVDYSQYIVPVINMSRCEIKSPPKVVVKVLNKKIKYDTSKSSAQLGNFDIDTISPYGANVHTRVSGLTAGKISVKMSASVMHASNRMLNKGCLWYDKITVHIINDPTVYIASEHNKNKCRYNKTLRHEMKHVIVDKRTVKEYSEKMKFAVKKRAKKVGVVGPKPIKGMKKAQQNMIDEINDTLKIVIDQMHSVRKKRQQTIDSKKEYDRLSKSCGGSF